jgi:hypothetical protein
MTSEKATNLLRDGENDHEIWPRNLSVQLPIHPVQRLLILACRAVAVAAGAKNMVVFSAVFLASADRASGINARASTCSGSVSAMLLFKPSPHRTSRKRYSLTGSMKMRTPSISFSLSLGAGFRFDTARPSVAHPPLIVEGAEIAACGYIAGPEIEPDAQGREYAPGQPRSEAGRSRRGPGGPGRCRV